MQIFFALAAGDIMLYMQKFLVLAAGDILLHLQTKYIYCCEPLADSNL